MTVSELIERLQEYSDGDMEVLVECQEYSGKILDLRNDSQKSYYGFIVYGDRDSVIMLGTDF